MNFAFLQSASSSPWPRLRKGGLLAGIGWFAVAQMQPVAAALTIQFDYSLDTGNFFTPERRATLEQVASIFGNNLANTFPARSGVNFQLGGFLDESGSAIPNSGVSISNLDLPADSVRFYVNAGNLGATTLGLSHVGTAMNGFGSLIFNSSLLTFADLLPPGTTDISPAGMEQWKFDNDIRTFESPEPFEATAVIPDFGPALLTFYQNDFATVAMHELGHVFGLEHSFDGGAMAAVYAGAGSRTLFTAGDWLAMTGKGWQVKSLSPDLNEVVTVVPEPGSVALLLAGAGAMAGWRWPGKRVSGKAEKAAR